MSLLLSYLLSDCMAIAQTEKILCLKANPKTFVIDYAADSSAYVNNSSSLFLHSKNRIIQLSGKLIGADRVAGLHYCIDIDSLQRLSEQSLFNLLNNKLIIQYDVEQGKHIYYELSYSNIFSIDGPQLYRIDANGVKQPYVNLQATPDKRNAVKKLHDGSIKVDPSIAFANRTYIRSTGEIGCFTVYKIVEQQGKHASIVYWVPEVGIIQERVSGYPNINAVQINGIKADAFIKNMCNNKDKL